MLGRHIYVDGPYADAVSLGVYVDKLVREYVRWAMDYKYATLHVIGAWTRIDGYRLMDMSWTA